MSKLDYSEIEKGSQIILNNQPYEIIECASMFKGRGHSVIQAKLKNLISGEIISKTIHPSDVFEEAEVIKEKAKFIYSHRGKYVFSKEENPSERFELTEEQIKESAKFLKPGLVVEALIFQDKVVNIKLPIKILLRVKEAPPGIKGDRAQGGTKPVILETGAEIQAPLFVEKDDIIEVNTEKQEYVRRVEKK